jgi:PKHD-type hydroxylase
VFLLTDPCLRADALSLGECVRLIDMFDTSPDIKAGRLSSGSETDTRICDTLWMDDTPETAWIFTRLAELVADVNRENFHFDLEEFRESAQILKYRAAVSASDRALGGESGGASLAGRYDSHVDIGGGGHSATRKLSLSIQLSAPDSYTGGGLQIGSAEEAWSAPRKPGTAILFPSFVRHSVAPLVSGIRYALVAWVHGPAFR